jgi:hypothetical protein
MLWKPDRRALGILCQTPRWRVMGTVAVWRIENCAILIRLGLLVRRGVPLRTSKEARLWGRHNQAITLMRA